MSLQLFDKEKQWLSWGGDGRGALTNECADITIQPEYLLRSHCVRRRPARTSAANTRSLYVFYAPPVIYVIIGADEFVIGP